MAIDREQRGPHMGTNSERREKLVKKERKRHKERKAGIASMLNYLYLT